jgi:asparagine synthase (glutamine-hydrolysing)
MFRDCRDVLIARQVARACEQPHEIIRVDEKFLGRFPEYAERTIYLTDGCADVSRSPDLYVNEAARQIAPVRMTGNYGGEVLRRIRAFKPGVPLRRLYPPELLSCVDQAEKTYAGLLQFHPLSFSVFRQAPWHHYGLFALEQTQLCLRSPYLDNDFVRTVFRAPQSAASSNDVCLRLIGDANHALRQLPTDRGLGGDGVWLSAAARHSFLEFQFKAEYAYDYGMPQWAVPIDYLFSNLHPERLFLGRHKFYHFRVWYRDALSEYVKEILLDPTALSRSHVERRTVEAVVKGHVKGFRNYTVEIHKLLTVELLHRLLLDAPPASARQRVA